MCSDVITMQAESNLISSPESNDHQTANEDIYQTQGQIYALDYLHILVNRWGLGGEEKKCILL